MALSVAFYGAGRRALPYLDALARQPGARVTAVCDLDRRAAEQVAAGWGARVFLSPDAMLQEARPDALWVCVGPHLQGDILLRAAEAGVPFVVEPPGATDFDRACACARVVREKRLVTAVGFTARYTDVVREARGYLGANPVPLALGWWLRPPGDDSAPDAAGLLWADGCRLLDALRFFGGEVTRVRALAAHAGTADGALVLQLEFAAGTVGLLTCATYSRPEPRVELELMGEGWTLGFGEAFASLRLAERDKVMILRRLNDPADDLTAAFLEAVAAGDPARVETGYAEALATLTVCRAAVVSAREGRAVEVAECSAAAGPPPSEVTSRPPSLPETG
jgi:myo-inositol 2-dehydrogenase / D-chiro-inositol 1-dehydrogenase